MSNQLLMRRRVMMAGDDGDYNYLRFTALEDNSTISLNKQGNPEERIVEYSVNGGVFRRYIYGNIITLSTDEYVEWRRAKRDQSDNFSTDDNNYYYFSATGKLYHSGLFTSLLRWKTPLTSIRSYAFDRLLYNVNSIVGGDGIAISDSVITIGRSAFYYCNSLYGTLSLPNTLLSIEYSVFQHCEHLTGDLIIPQNCVLSETLYYNTAFSYCGFNGKLVFPGVNKRISQNAFYGNNFVEVYIGEGVESIGQYVFTTNVPCNVFLPETPPTLVSTNAFSAKQIFYVPYSADHSILNAYKTDSVWSGLANRIFELDENGEIPV